MGRVSDARERLLTAVTDLMWENSYGCATVEAICTRAKVKKGSFYYFFESKSELAVAALEDHWQRALPGLEHLFATDTPPVERLISYFKAVYDEQRDCCHQRSYTLGCPYLNIGAEMCTQDPNILQRVRSILDDLYRFFEHAVSDAKAAGLADIPDPAATARCIFNLYEGALTQARVYNNLDLLHDLPAGALQLLGVRQGTLGNSAEINAAA
jgi:TetR/AcrR family transcriptional repressor of nem operon